MAFDRNNLSVLAYANGFTLWHYKSADIATDVDGAGYFNSANEMVRVGDMILANVGNGASHGIFVVNANASGVVDVANLTNFASSDTD
jgi:hypothetical protein